MLDRSLGKTFANLSTLVLLACVFTLPIHVIHAYVFKDALAVAELSPEIQAFPEGRQVRGVARADLDLQRNTLLVVLGIELLALPLAYRASRRVIEVDDDARVPTVVDAWTHLGSSPAAALHPGPILIGAVIGAMAGWLVWMIGSTLSDMASADIAWAVTGLARGLGVALSIAIVCGVAAALPDKGPNLPAPEQNLDVY
jgi:hypothetical protein